MTITCFCCDVSPEECLTLRAINEEARERAAGAQSITISRDTYELLKEAAEEWAKDWRRPTQLLRTVRCKSCLSATRIDELSTYHSAMVVHAADCKAARILGLDREHEGKAQ